jgi:ribosome modulation factor
MAWACGFQDSFSLWVFERHQLVGFRMVSPFGSLDGVTLLLSGWRQLAAFWMASVCGFSGGVSFYRMVSPWAFSDMASACGFSDGVSLWLYGWRQIVGFRMVSDLAFLMASACGFKDGPACGFSDGVSLLLSGWCQLAALWMASVCGLSGGVSF